jgi:hypothetical protein
MEFCSKFAKKQSLLWFISLTSAARPMNGGNGIGQLRDKLDDAVITCLQSSILIANASGNENAKTPTTFLSRIINTNLN